MTATTTPTAGGDPTAQETSLDTTVSTSTGGGQETDGEAGNSIDGGYTSTVSASDSTTTASTETIGPETVTDSSGTTALGGVLTIVTTSTTGDTSSSTEGGNSITGDYGGLYGSTASDAWTTTSHVVRTDATTGGTDTDTSDITDNGSTTSSEAGNSVSGDYSTTTSGSDTTVTIEHETNVLADGTNVLDVYTTTTVVGATGPTTEAGNSIVGYCYTTGGGSDTTTVVQNGQAGPDSFSLTSTAGETYTTTAYDNSVTGSYNSDQNGYNTYHLDKSDTYADGSDNETVDRNGTDMLSTSSGNSFTGDYADAAIGTSATTVAESGNQGNPYTFNSSDTYGYGTTGTGDSISGDYIDTSDSNDTGNQTWTTDDGVFTVITASQPLPGVTYENTSTKAGNSVLGDFNYTATQEEQYTTDEGTWPAGSSFTVYATETLESTTSAAGNTIAGDYSATEQETVSTTLYQLGSDAGGSFSVNETTADSPTLTTTGNSVTGQYTTVETGAVIYTLDEMNGDAAGGYELSGGGTQGYTRTDVYNTNTGVRTSTETGSDAYSLNDHGTDSVGYFNQTLTGTDAYTTVATSNDLDGGYTRTTSGSGGYTLVENDDGDDPVTTTGNHSFTTTGSGNYVDGQVALSATGVDRYMLLRGFNNTSNGALGTEGTVDYSPVGSPFFLGNGVEGPTGGGSRAAATDAVFGDPGSLPYQHCFAAGTQVLMADGSFKAIETIQPGEMVLAVSDRDPEGPVEARPVAEVYHNAPARILELHVATGSPLPLGEGQGVRAARGLAQAGRGGRGHREAREESVAGVALLDAPPADGVIRTTPNHPFYVRDRGWVQARDLRVGARFRSRDGGESELVGALDAGTVERVFNLHVRGCRTYFVAGDDDRTTLLVHNDSANPAGLFTGAAPPLDFDLKGAALTLNYTNGPDGGIVVQIPGAGQTNSFLADPNWTLPFELGELNGTTSPGVAAGQPGAGVGDSLPLPEVPTPPVPPRGGQPNSPGPFIGLGESTSFTGLFHGGGGQTYIVGVQSGTPETLGIPACVEVNKLFASWSLNGSPGEGGSLGLYYYPNGFTPGSSTYSNVVFSGGAGPLGLNASQSLTNPNGHSFSINVGGNLSLIPSESLIRGNVAFQTGGQRVTVIPITAGIEQSLGQPGGLVQTVSLIHDLPTPQGDFVNGVGMIQRASARQQTLQVYSGYGSDTPRSPATQPVTSATDQ